MSTVLFGQAYYLRFDPRLWKEMKPYAPVGTLFAASYLRERGHDVALFDAVLAESEDEWAAALDREKPSFAIIYEDNFNYLSKMCLLRMRKAAFTMAKMARERGCTVIVGGSDATDQAAEYLAKGAHYVLLGEGEHTLGELMDRLTGKTETALEGIQGLAFPATDRPEGDPSGVEVTHTARRPVIRDLDSLPLPAWDLVDVPRYRKIWMKRHGYFSMNLTTTRGCPYHCNWCAKPIWGQRYGVRSPENVVAEMKLLKEHYGPDHFWVMDDIMGLRAGWFAQFADLVESEGVRTRFRCLSRVDLLLREGEIEALRRAGGHLVWIGAESGSQSILDAMDKGTRVEQMREVTEKLHEAGVEVAFFLQFGYPGETRADIEATLQMVRDCMPDELGISVSYPLPGTKFYTAVREQLGDQQHWEDSSDLAMLYEGPFTTAFYRKLHTLVHREYRARKYWRALKDLLRHPSHFQKQHLRQIPAMVCYALMLPVDRMRLEQLARIPHAGIGSLPVLMTAEEAATPTPQEQA